MNIKWWDELKEVERKRLLQRMQLAGSPIEERKNFCLEYDGITYDQWNYEGHTCENF